MNRLHLRAAVAQICLVWLTAASAEALWTHGATQARALVEQGYFAMYTFNGEGCETEEVMAARAYLTGRCIQSDTTSFMYTCGDEGLTATQYSDAACGEVVGSITIANATMNTCSTNGAPTSSLLAVCEPTIRYELEGESVVSIYESENSCDEESQLVQQQYYVSNRCFSTSNYSFYYGCDGSALTQAQYSSAGCDSASLVVEGTMYDIGVCTSVDDSTSYDAVCGGASPPTQAPTPAPVPSGAFWFSVELAFSGVSAEELTGSQTEQQILTDALAQCDEHISSEDVTITRILEYSDPSTKLHARRQRRRRLQSATTQVTFEVKAYLSAFGYTELTEDNYNAAYGTLSQSMETYVVSGAYDEAIQTMAANQGVEFGATSIPASLDIGDAEYDDKVDDDDNHPHHDDDDEPYLIGGLTPGAFAGAMVATVVMAAIAVGLVFYVRNAKSEPKSNSAPRLQQPLLGDAMSI